MKLAIANEKGEVNLKRTKLSKRYEQVRGYELALICQRLKIRYAEAVVGFVPMRYGAPKPIKDGVVVSARSAPKLREEIAARAARIAEREEKQQKKRERELARATILQALWTLNRRAKRCRDLAQTYYQCERYGLASTMRCEKEEIYASKEQALHYLLKEGQLSVIGHHRFEGGNWAEILEGEGYQFHRPCPAPEAAAGEEVELPGIESKSKGAGELTLDIAWEVVRKYLEGRPRVEVYEWLMHWDRE